MIISNQKNSFGNTTIQDSILMKVSTVKFLDVTLDENLTFNDHVNKVTTKILKYFGVMGRLYYQLPEDVMVKLYYSYVYSSLTYVLQSLGGLGRTNAAEIESAHRRASKLLSDYNQKNLTFHSIYDYFCSIKGFQHKYP